MGIVNLNLNRKMVETTDQETANYEEAKPMFFNHNDKISAMNCGDLGIPEIKDEHCKVLRVHKNSVDCVSANPKSEKEFATGSHDKTIIVWDAETGKVKKQMGGNA